MNQLTPPIKWHGGKHYLAPRIIELVRQVPHTHRVETHVGGGAVTLQMPDDLIEGHSEAVNDIDYRLTNFWAALQGEESFQQLKRRIEATPFSQVEWESSRAESHDYGGGMPGMAAAFFVNARQSRQGLMKDFATLSRNRTRRGMNEQVSSWLTAIEGLPDVHARLKRVVILNDDANKVIVQQDGPNTLFYCDPPYLHETRVTTSDYAHEMSVAQHEALLCMLAGAHGKFILSGYPSELYTRYANANGWHRIDIQIDNKASSKAVKEIKTECLWMNFTPAEAS